MHSKNLRAYLDSAAAIAALLPQAERLIELAFDFDSQMPEDERQSVNVGQPRHAEELNG